VQEIPVVGYALLALLARVPSTGYELTARMSSPMGAFWTAPHSQIYPQLISLEGAGLIRHRADPGPGPRLRKTYRLTAAGRRALARWVISPPGERVPRDELVLRAYAAPVADHARLAELFRDQERQHRKVLRGYQRIRRELAEELGSRLTDPSSPSFGNVAILERGIGAEREYVRWCRWMAERLESCLTRDTVVP